MIAYLNQLDNALIVHNNSVFFLELDNEQNIIIKTFIGDVVDDKKKAERIISKAISMTYKLCAGGEGQN